MGYDRIPDVGMFYVATGMLLSMYMLVRTTTCNRSHAHILLRGMLFFVYAVIRKRWLAQQATSN